MSLADWRKNGWLVDHKTGRETLEQMAEGYRRLELVKEEAEAQAYPKRTEAKRMVAYTAENVRSGIELMDQTDECSASRYLQRVAGVKLILCVIDLI